MSEADVRQLLVREKERSRVLAQAVLSLAAALTMLEGGEGTVEIVRDGDIGSVEVFNRDGERVATVEAKDVSTGEG